MERSQPLKLQHPPKTRLTPTNPDASQYLIYCNTDVAWKPVTKEEITRGHMYQDFVSSPGMAEVLAVRCALHHSTSHNFKSIWLCSYCKCLIQAISAKQRSVELFGMLSFIVSFSSI
ncbi:Uncharacterized protein Rs2_33184 [Raphanus sativus]|nr:Uncharacterized protein Rs2_33184 [Raphanus sativus]